VAEEIDKGTAGAEQCEIDIGGYLQPPGDQIGGVDGVGMPLDEDGRNGIKTDHQPEQGCVQ
jgi:hypothetical protein